MATAEGVNELVANVDETLYIVVENYEDDGAAYDSMRVRVDDGMLHIDRRKTDSAKLSRYDDDAWSHVASLVID